MNIPWVNLSIQHQELREEINTVIQEVLDRTNFVLGEDVEHLEEEFASYCGTKYAIGVDSGLSALKLSLIAFGIGKGDEVIVPTHTFTATAAAVTFSGATPVFVDSDQVTWNIDPEKIESAITTKTKAIIPVHIYGLPADMDAILEIAKRNNLVVVEDACQAHGASYKGRRAGSMGHAAGFSFYPTKNLGACGDGGIVTTNDEEVAETIRALRNCGQRSKNVHELQPFNHRLDNIQAAILRVKLKHLDDFIDSRRRIASFYNSKLNEAGLMLPAEPSGYKHVYHLYVIRTPLRDELQSYLAKKGIGSSIHYPNPVHLQPFYSNGSDQQRKFPVAEKICKEILSIPMFPELTDEQATTVVSEIVNRPVL